MKHTGAEPRKQDSTLREKRPEFLPLLCSVRQFISFVTRSLQCFLDQEDGGEGRRKQQCGAQLFHQSSTTTTLFTLYIYINTHTRHTEKRKKNRILLLSSPWAACQSKMAFNRYATWLEFLLMPDTDTKRKGGNGFCAVLCFLSVWHGLCRLVAKDMSVGWGGRTGSVAEECGSPFHVICRVKLNGLPFLLFFPSQTSGCCGSH